MQIQHKAFLDLENGLTRRAVSEWDRIWLPLRKELRQALTARNWVAVDRLIDQLSTDRLIPACSRYAQTVGLSSLLLGASRLSDVHTARVGKSPPLLQLRNGVTQWGYGVARNASQLLRRQLHVAAALLEHEAVQDQQKVEKAVQQRFDFDTEADALLDSAAKAGPQMFNLASSLLVSRLSSYGFLLEAKMRGLQQYMVSEVMDDHTCPVCEVMNGQVFPIAAGLAHSETVLSAEDPDSLRSVAPWPSQSKASVADLADSSPEDLVAGGLALPPYHPGCRGIVVSADVPPETATASGATAEARRLKLPRVSEAALAALLGITQGNLTPARTHNGAELVGQIDPDESNEDAADDEAFEKELEAEDRRAAKKKKKPTANI